MEMHIILQKRELNFGKQKLMHMLISIKKNLDYRSLSKEIINRIKLLELKGNVEGVTN